MTYYDPHLDHRKSQEKAHLFTDDPMTSLVTVEMNITELCNRKCVFCPRVDPKVYPNRNLHMHEGTVATVASELNLLGSQARISFSGFGEPLLHPRFSNLISTARLFLEHNTIECNTNGDKLTAGKIKELFEAGMSWLYVNMYDGPEQEAPFHAMFKEAGITKYKLRPHWIESHGLTLNNRSGTLAGHEAASGRCHYPFYKMLVDWNGDVLFCSNDWGRKIIVGNVLKQSLRDIWLSEQMKEIRLGLSKGDRNRDPCNACSVAGTLSGKPSHDLLLEHYAN